MWCGSRAESQATSPSQEQTRPGHLTDWLMWLESQPLPLGSSRSPLPFLPCSPWGSVIISQKPTPLSRQWTHPSPRKFPRAPLNPLLIPRSHTHSLHYLSRILHGWDHTGCIFPLDSLRKSCCCTHACSFLLLNNILSCGYITICWTFVLSQFLAIMNKVAMNSHTYFWIDKCFHSSW